MTSEPEPRSQTFEDMAKSTVASYLRTLAELQDAQHGVPATGEQATAVLLEIIRVSYEAIWEGALRSGVRTGYAMAPLVQAPEVEL